MVHRLNGSCELPSDPKSKILKQQGVVSALVNGRLALRRDSPWLKQCADDTQEALEAEAERDMSGLGRSISTMSFNSGERGLAHQFSGNVASMGGSSPHLGHTGAISHQV